MIAPQTGRIFISYRRADSAGYAGRIYDRLAAHFGEDAIFMDVDTIEAGLDFVEVLESAVQSCDVLVALMGRQWLNIKDVEGKRRLDNPQDFVRIEVVAALKRRIRVIPVLFDGTHMPGYDQLPRGLKALARRNAVLVNHHSFHTDANHLIEQLELALKAAEDSKILKIKEQKEKETQKKRLAEIENLLSQADIALDLRDWELAKEKLNAILELEPDHVQTQVKLTIVDRKLGKIKEQDFAAEKDERESVEKAAKEKLEREAAEKAAREKAERERLEREEKARKEKEAGELHYKGMLAQKEGKYDEADRLFRQSLEIAIELKDEQGKANLLHQLEILTQDRLAREKVEREAAREDAAREKAEREASERAVQEKAQRESAEKAALEKAERERLEREEKAERETAEKVPEEKITHETPQEKARREATERWLARKVEREAKQKATQNQTFSSVNDTVFFLSWQKRMLIGGVTGLLSWIMAVFLLNASDQVVEPGSWVFSIVGCGLAGVMLYPHKSSVVFLSIGFLVWGVFGAIYGGPGSSTTAEKIALFVVTGVFFGSLTGGLISRILYWLKVIK